MSTAISTGQSARQAFRFLREVHKDTVAVVKALDSLMANRKWYPTQKNRISNELSNGLYADTWLIQSIYRLYVNNTDVKTADRVAAVHIEFNPPEMYEEPVTLCLSATFPQLVSTQDMWDRWEYEGSVAVLQDLSGNRQPKSLPQPLLKAVFPLASSGKAFAIGLLELSSEMAVQNLVVSPLLAGWKGK